MTDHSGIGLNSTTYFETQSNGLDFFPGPSFDETLNGFSYRSYKTLNAISNQGPFLFQIGSPDFNQYTQLPSLRLEGIIKVKKSGGSDLDTGEAISIVNLFPHSLFDHINVSLNNTPVKTLLFLFKSKFFISSTIFCL